MTNETAQGAHDWKHPVFVQAGIETPKAIQNPKAALLFLSKNWRGPKTLHAFAKEICAAAIAGHVSSYAAREAFVHSVTAARMTVCAPNPHSLPEENEALGQQVGKAAEDAILD